MLGLPDSSRDLIIDKTILLEAGFDELNGIDWEKGCYIGQEVTARTYYRGLVKRRLFPISTHKTALTHGSDILLTDRIVGKLGSVAQKNDKAVGLASLRLDAVQQSLDNQKKSGSALLSLEDGTPLFLNIPSWMHPLPGFDTAED